MKLVLFLAVSAAAVAVVCKALCFPEHPQTSFCNADYGEFCNGFHFHYKTEKSCPLLPLDI